MLIVRWLITKIVEDCTVCSESYVQIGVYKLVGNFEYEEAVICESYSFFLCYECWSIGVVLCRGECF